MAGRNPPGQLGRQPPAISQPGANQSMVTPVQGMLGHYEMVMPLRGENKLLVLLFPQRNSSENTDILQQGYGEERTSLLGAQARGQVPSCQGGNNGPLPEGVKARHSAADPHQGKP